MKCIWPKLFLYLFIFTACTHGNSTSNLPSGQSRSKLEILLDSVYSYHGTDRVFNSTLGFGVENKIYSVSHSANDYTYTCLISDMEGRIVHTITPMGFTETINNIPVALTANDSLQKAHGMQMDIFYALLPLALKGDDVKLSLEGEDEINGKRYYRLKTEWEEGIEKNKSFLFWFDTSDFSLDFFIGSPFGKWNQMVFNMAGNARRVNGIVFQDYKVFKIDAAYSLDELLEKYETNQLEKIFTLEFNRLSVIENPVQVSAYY